MKERLCTPPSDLRLKCAPSTTIDSQLRLMAKATERRRATAKRRVLWFRSTGCMIRNGRAWMGKGMKSQMARSYTVAAKSNNN